MNPLLTGIHHVTALAKDPTKNHRFYTEVLGCRMVKKTVNFDDPMTYHLYFGDHQGSPGTLLTHFPHPNAKRGVHGSPEILETRLRIPKHSSAAWADRLAGFETPSVLKHDGDDHRLAFADHDGMLFALVEDDHPADDASIRGIDSVAISVPEIDPMRSFLEDVLGFSATTGEGERQRFVLGDGGPGRRLDLLQAPADPGTTMGAGTVHHVAWRVPDDDAQARVASALANAGIAVTPVMDRQYFRSIYFRVPGGVIFEVATDGPGFDVDEPLDTLGEALKLPPQYESRRDAIAAHLVPLGPAT